MGIQKIGNPGLWIKKMEGIVHQPRFIPIGIVSYPSILKVPKEFPMVGKIVNGLGKDIKVGLVRIILIITFLDIAFTCIPGPYYFPIVPSFILVPSTPSDYLYSIPCIVGRKDGTIIIIVQPFLTNKICCVQVLSIHNNRFQSIFC